MKLHRLLPLPCFIFSTFAAWFSDAYPHGYDHLGVVFCIQAVVVSVTSFFVVAGKEGWLPE